MAKKASRRKKTSTEAARQTKKQIAMGRKEARQNRIILILVGALVAAIVIIIAVGIVSELIIKPNSPVAEVNGTKIRVQDYQNLVTYNRYNYYNSIANLQDGLAQLNQAPEENSFLIMFYEQQLSQLQTALLLTTEDSLDELIEAELAQQKAEELQITVTDQEVDQAIGDEFRGALAQQAQETITGTEELLTPTPIAQEQVDSLYENVLTAMHISDDAFRTIIRRNLMLSEVQDALAAEVPTTGLVVDLELIGTEFREAALVAQARVERGEDFAIVAQELSTDTGSAVNGGDLGWFGRGRMVAPFEETAFALEVGEISDPVQSDFGWHIIQKLGDEIRPLDDATHDQNKQTVFNEWLAVQNEEAEIETFDTWGEVYPETPAIPPDYLMFIGQQ